MFEQADGSEMLTPERGLCQPRKQLTQSPGQQGDASEIQKPVGSGSRGAEDQPEAAHCHECDLTPDMGGTRPEHE